MKIGIRQSKNGEIKGEISFNDKKKLSLNKSEVFELELKCIDLEINAISRFKNEIMDLCKNCEVIKQKIKDLKSIDYTLDYQTLNKDALKTFYND